MSVTVAATPILLISFSKIAALMASATAFSGTFFAVANGNAQAQSIDNKAIEDFNKINNDIKRIMQENNNNITEEVAKEVIDTICREYETVFASQEVLLKTLEEHGFENIQQIEGDNISCELNVLKLVFYRNSQEEPYSMKITAECTDNEIQDLLNDITSEYTSNSQEESYIKIKERLENQGLKIDDEEICEDDTIVLTVNID